MIPLLICWWLEMQSRQTHMQIPEWLPARYPFLNFTEDSIFLQKELLAQLPPQKMQTILAELLSDIFQAGLIIRQLNQSLFLLNHATGLESSHLERLQDYHLLGSTLEIFSGRQREKLKSVKTSKDRYTAYIRIDSTVSSQSVPLDADVLIAHLWLAGVRYGFRSSLIKAALAFANGKVDAAYLLRYYEKHDLPLPIREDVLPIALGKRLIAQECTQRLVWHVSLENENVLNPAPSDFSETNGHPTVSSGTVLAECHYDGVYSPGIRVDGKVEIPLESKSHHDLETAVGDGVTLLKNHKGIQKLVATADGALCKKEGRFTVIPATCPLHHQTEEDDILLDGEVIILEEDDFPSTQEMETRSHLSELEHANDKIVANLHQITDKLQKAAEVLETRQSDLSESKLKMIETHYRQIIIQRNQELSAKARLTAQIRRAKQDFDRQTAADHPYPIEYSPSQALTA